MPEAAALSTGDQLLILGETTGVVEFRADEIRVEERPAEVALQGVRCSLKTPVPVRRNDKLYKLVEV